MSVGYNSLSSVSRERVLAAHHGDWREVAQAFDRLALSLGYRVTHVVPVSLG